MSTSIIDGTVEEVDVKTYRAGVRLFRTIRFRLDDGSEHTAKKLVTTKQVGDELTPGARGRFYLFKAFDIKGVHGVRTPDGREVFDFPSNNKKIFLIAGVLGVVWNILLILTRDAISLLGVAMIVLGAFGYYFMGKGKTEAQAQFDGDAGYRPG